MSQSTDVLDIQLKKNFTMLKMLMDKTELESTHKIVLDIIKGETKLGREQRYQAISKITDILNNTDSEQEIVNKLKKEYPQYS